MSSYVCREHHRPVTWRGNGCGRCDQTRHRHRQPTRLLEERFGKWCRACRVRYGDNSRDQCDR